ncbi:MAG: ATP synthase F0 subunit B [Bdellovibrionaceae bacterium]|nr:ATP synthase F0 subunit B [Pseudobdellovibrionaceae bacterium]
MLNALGLNHTAFLQFAIFSVTFFVLTFGLFSPFAKALEERQERTKGASAASEDLVNETNSLRQQFETKARSINGEIKSIYDENRSQGVKESEKILTTAREQANSIVEKARASVAAQVTEAQRKLKDEVPVVANAIAAKLLSKKANS